MSFRRYAVRGVAGAITAAIAVVAAPVVAHAVTPPAVAITAPSADAVLTGLVTVAADATADGESGQSVASVEFRVDGVPIGSDDAAPYEVTWDATAATGAHVLTAIVTDAPDGATTTSAEVPVVVAGPTVSVTAPAAGAEVYGDVPLSAGAAPYDGNGSSVTSVAFYAGGALVGEDTTAPYDVTWPTDVLPEGEVALRAVATDSNGQRTESAPVTVSVARPAPTVTVTAPGPGTVVSGAVALEAAASAYTPAGYTVAQVEFLVDGVVVGTDTTAPFSVTWDTATATAGTHAVTARAYDAPRGGSAESPAVAVSVAGAPVVDSVTPAVARRGATVVLAGRSFTGTTSVTFGSVAAAFSIGSDTRLTAVVPATASAPGVTVTNARGSGSAGFTVDPPPPPALTFSARPGDRVAVLRWTRPAVSDLAAIVVRRAVGSAPASPTAGTLVYQGLGTSYTNTGLANGTTYGYAIWLRDTAGSYSERRWFNVKPVPPVRSTLAVGISAGLLNHGGTVTVTGLLRRSSDSRGVAGEPVDVYVRRTGTSTWTRLGRATTSSTGHVRWTFRPAWNAEYTLRHPSTWFYAASGSWVVRVGVRPVVTARVNLTSALVGTPATVSGSVTPAHAGQSVQVQQLVSGAWRTIASARLGSTGGYSATVRPAGTGVLSLRVLKPADADHAATATGVLRLTRYSVVIATINWDAAGNDLYNPNGEWVVLRNAGAVAVNLSGWRLYAGDAGQNFTLPSYPLAPGVTVRVYSGVGTNGSGRIHLDRNQPIWNNDGEVGLLYDPRGARASRYAY